ncbi:S53 family peptidase [Bryocella elongata]|nr:S53 family serine peptidase [Bryocella elongata]
MRTSHRSLFQAASAVLVAVAVCGASGQAQAQTQTSRSRITAAIDNGQRTTLAHSRPARAVADFDRGQVDSKLQLQGLELTFNMSDAQQADLDALIAAQQDSSSAQYHQWLTPAQFATRFGMSDADLAKAEAWLSSQGFSVTGVSANRLGITFDGTAAQVASAFGTSLHYYRSSSDTESHYAPSSDLSIPAALAGVAAGVRHLSNFRVLPHTQLRSPVSVRPDFTSSQTGGHFLTPADVATVYNIKAAYNAGYTGTGQTIAVIGQSAIVATDITNFQTAAGVAVRAPTQTILPGTGCPLVFTDDEAESDLDLEYSSGIATGATINFVYAGGGNYNNSTGCGNGTANEGVFDAMGYAIQNKLGQIITVSYGECEYVASNGTSPAPAGSDVATYELLLKQAATLGETVINSSGDDGSTSCAGQYGTSGLNSTELATEQTLNVSYPASSAYVVGVGGTEFPAADTGTSATTYWASASGSDVISSALSYIPEQVWNDDTAGSTTATLGTSLSNYLSSSGGGVSTLFARPSWQTSIASTSTGFYRLVPDISLAASPSYPGYLYCSSDTSTGITGSCSHGFRDSTSTYLTVAGGTSFAAPIFAGLVAIINQYKNATTGQGLITPALYAMASNSTTYASAFHDVTSGGNECTVGVSLCGSGNDNLWYTANTGYDMATGLGSPNFYNMMTAWTSGSSTSGKSFTLAASPTTLTIASGSTGTTSVTVTPAGGYTGTVAWSISSSPTLNYACYTIPTATITGTTATSVTLSVIATNSGCQAGAAFKSAGTTVSVNEAPASKAPASPAPGHSKLPEGLALAGLLTTGYFGRRSRKLKGLVAMGLLMVGGLSLTGCSSGTVNTSTSTGTGTTTTTSVSQTVTTATKGTYTLTITGTDTTNSAITASTTLTLTVD